MKHLIPKLVARIHTPSTMTFIVRITDQTPFKPVRINAYDVCLHLGSIKSCVSMVPRTSEYLAGSLVHTCINEC